MQNNYASSARKAVKRQINQTRGSGLKRINQIINKQHPTLANIHEQTLSKMDQELAHKTNFVQELETEKEALKNIGDKNLDKDLLNHIQGFSSNSSIFSKQLETPHHGLNSKQSASRRFNDYKNTKGDSNLAVSTMVDDMGDGPNPYSTNQKLKIVPHTYGRKNVSKAKYTVREDTDNRIRQTTTKGHFYKGRPYGETNEEHILTNSEGSLKELGQYDEMGKKDGIFEYKHKNLFGRFPSEPSYRKQFKSGKEVTEKWPGGFFEGESDLKTGYFKNGRITNNEPYTSFKGTFKDGSAFKGILTKEDGTQFAIDNTFGNDISNDTEHQYMTLKRDPDGTISQGMFDENKNLIHGTRESIKDGVRTTTPVFDGQDHGISTSRNLSNGDTEKKYYMNGEHVSEERYDRYIEESLKAENLQIPQLDDDYDSDIDNFFEDHNVQDDDLLNQTTSSSSATDNTNLFPTTNYEDDAENDDIMDLLDI